LLSYIPTDGQPKLHLAVLSDSLTAKVVTGQPYLVRMRILFPFHLAAPIHTGSTVGCGLDHNRILAAYAMYRLAGKRASAGVKPESVHNEGSVKRI
ncbi:MAG: hypothetical protein MZV63_25335, partial [Marinilabiliales bacterium]|nr:hypothetical protein [Marinilabiliales bacterium]